MIKATVKKGIQWDVVSFVILTTIVPIIMFLVFYVYVSFDSVLMAFRDEDTMVYSFKYFQIFFIEKLGKIPLGLLCLLL